MKIEIALIQVTPFEENCRVIIDRDSETALVCDPGDSAQQIKAQLDKENLELKAILLTHAHLDHIGAVKELSALTGARIIGPALDDAYLIEHIADQALGLGLPQCEPFTPEYVEDNQELNLIAGLPLKVITTPGHTPGGVCYYCESLKFLLSGDTLFYCSVGRTDFPRGNFEDLRSSIRDKLFSLPDDTAVLCGHGPDTSIGFEKKSNRFVL
ncbi:MAG: MBL fold metallo-hydrolase [Succinivibrio sp.]|nr:MBL fold metallo-hydrolase [Succinivibrio sp.]